MNHEELQTLLRARARVDLPADYPQQLLRALHEKQRSELLQKSLWRLAGDRFKTYWSEHSVSTPVYALGWAAIFAIGLTTILLFKPAGNAPALTKDSPSAVSPMRPPVNATPVTFENQGK